MAATKSANNMKMETVRQKCIIKSKEETQMALSIGDVKNAATRHLAGGTNSGQ
jgi:hypothetical protein